MGSHVWEAQCPYCGFEEASVSSYDGTYFEVACQICGYRKWTEDRVPGDQDIEKAKQILSKMDDKERQKAKELYCQDGVPLVTRLTEDCKEGQKTEDC